MPSGSDRGETHDTGMGAVPWPRYLARAVDHVGRHPFFRPIFLPCQDLHHRRRTARSPTDSARWPVCIEQPLRSRFLGKSPPTDRGSEEALQPGQIERGSLWTTHDSGSRSGVLLERTVALSRLVSGRVPADSRRIVAVADRLITKSSKQAQCEHAAQQALLLWRGKRTSQVHAMR